MTRVGLRDGSRLGLLTLAIACGLCGCDRTGSGDRGAVPEEVVRHNIIGTSLLSQQKWDEAREQFELALKQRPDDPVPLVNAAVTLIQQAREEEAEAYLRRALAADPDHLWAHYNLGLIEKNKGNLEESARHLTAVVEADPDEVAARYNLASVLTRLERNDEAEAMYRAALVLNPTHVSTLYGLGRLLLQQGREEDGVAMISESQRIRTESGIDTAMGNQYGEQGPYAMGVDYPGGGLAAPEAIPVVLRPAAPGEADAAIEAHWSGSPLLAPWPDPRLGVPWVATAVGDADGSGELDVVALLEPGGEGGSSWPLLVAPSIAADPATIPEQLLGIDHDGERPHAHAVLVDSDHDGDLDLFACLAGGSGSTCFIADNDGAGHFEIRSRDTGIELGPIAQGPVRLGFSDVDNDRDVDLLVVEPGGIHLFGNLRDGSFENVSDRAGLGDAIRGGASVAVADVDKNGWMDLVVGTPGGPLVVRNDRGRFEADGRLAAAAGSGDGGAVVLDYDNDGFLDIAALAAGRLRLYRNTGRGEWSDSTNAVLGGASSLGSAIPLATIDLDADGDLDLLVQVAAGFTFLWNDGGNANRWISIAPDGVRDNKFGIGTKVEVLAGALRQKFEVAQPLPVHAGLGSRDHADGVRLLWPGGVLQDEIDLPAGEHSDIAQLDRKGTSCPLLYAWRDGRWQFVTDFLGGCAIGYRHSPTELSVPDTDEYVKIEGGLDAHDGVLRVRLNNQLEEVIWFDRAELVVVDHPAGTEAFPDERLMPGPPWPEFRIFASARVQPIVAAREVESGRDVTTRLAALDREYVEGFRLLPFKGYAEMHTLELDLGELPPGERIVLLLDGWIDYADSTANIAASHAGASLVAPRLLVADGREGWIEVEDRMGFPAGLPKTMTLDLSDAFPSADRRLRIATTMRIYWDRARVMVGGADTPLQVSRLTARDADLRFGGFPAGSSVDGDRPFGYDPERVSTVSPWKAHAGAYTAFGSVRELLREIDDRFVTTRSGDEIELAFDAPAPPPAGLVRTYLLYADGFGKDMDPNSAASDRVGPIPFHGMPVYPYPHESGAMARKVAEEDDRPPRIVLDVGDGAPGAVPLALRIERRQPRK